MYASARRLWVRALDLFLIVPSAQGDDSYEREMRGERFILCPLPARQG